jgi:hypothetical protein
MKPVDLILNKILAAGVEPVETASGWESRCPAHDDQKASLSIAEAADGKVLIRCHAGCATEAIVEKLGLKMADLFPPKADTSIVYQYRDADGKVVLEKVRHMPKRFTQRRPDGEGGYIYSLKAGWYRKENDEWAAIRNATNPDQPPRVEGAKWFAEVPHVLYRLPEVTEAVRAERQIFYVEGEKDVENLVKVGRDATTNSGGAGETWRNEYGEVLRGATVIFIPDRDKAGGELFERYAPGLLAAVKELRRLDLPEGVKDISDWLAAGHGVQELDALAAAAPVWTVNGPHAEILDSNPETIRRPLCIVGDHAYLTTWVSVRTGGEDAIRRVVLRDEGTMYSDAAVPGALPLTDLGVAVKLPHVPHSDSIMSGAALKRYAAGERVQPVEVFNRIQGVVDHFMDFSHSVGTQADLVDMISLYIYGCYLLDAFTVIGYLWPNGDKGVGKTKLLVVVTDLAYLGVLVTAGGTFASLRDLADYGACIGFDDSESIMDVRRADPDKRTLLLAGNRRGTYVTLKEPLGDGWTTRYIHAFCPRLFSAINLPDEVLASRSIVVPLVRSADGQKANRDPADHETWPVDRRRLVDDLWSLGLANLTAVRAYDRKVTERTTMVGRVLEPWRAILTVALWLQEKQGMTGIFDRMLALAERYQGERGDIEEASPVRVLILALIQMLEPAKGDGVKFTPTELANIMNTIAQEEDIDHPGETFTNARKVGRLLQRLRANRAERTAGSKRWSMTKQELESLMRAYGMMGGQCRNAVSAIDAVSRDTPSTTTANGTEGKAISPKCHDAVCAVDAVSRGAPFGERQSASTAEEPASTASATAANDLNWGAA